MALWIAWVIGILGGAGIWGLFELLTAPLAMDSPWDLPSEERDDCDTEFLRKISEEDDCA